VHADDEFASARHAQVLWRAEDQAWWIEDNLSRNGTFVNDQRVMRSRLKDGDVIRVGRVRFKFESEGANEHLHPPS
jgi:pSer/pThr/pTyr-binding forkhead associated (FHA) protein